MEFKEDKSIHLGKSPPANQSSVHLDLEEMGESKTEGYINLAYENEGPQFLKSSTKPKKNHVEIVDVPQNDDDKHIDVKRTSSMNKHQHKISVLDTFRDKMHDLTHFDVYKDQERQKRKQAIHRQRKKSIMVADPSERMYWYNRYDPEGELDKEDEELIVLSNHQELPKKDFATEVRATMDVSNFLNNALLLLDVQGTSVDDIISNILEELLRQSGEKEASLQEIKNAILINESVGKFSTTMQGAIAGDDGVFHYDHTWLCILANLQNIQTRHVAIARLKNSVNLDRNSQDVHFIIMVAAPTKEKGTKNAEETGRTFATLFTDQALRQQLLHAETKEEFMNHMKNYANMLGETQVTSAGAVANTTTEEKPCCFLGSGIRTDLKKRLPCYISDYTDGVRGRGTLAKTISTALFLYFACLLPDIAFGMLNDTNTKGKIDVLKVIYAQTIGGLLFALFGGQPMTILLTTAPLAIFTKVIYQVAGDMDVDFYAMYATVGLFNTGFLMLYSVFNLSKMMKWSTRSTEEIFALFISIAFTVDAIKDVVKNFDEHYTSESCKAIHDYKKNNTDAYNQQIVLMNTTLVGVPGNDSTMEYCEQSTSLLFLLLVLGTVWLGIKILNFTDTPYLNHNKRKLLADYALPVSVVFMSFIGSYVFRDIELKSFTYVEGESIFKIAPIDKMTLPSIFIAMALGFCLSLLFFMDQNISSAMVNNPENKLKKGPAYHWDLMVVAIINGFLTITGLPMVHGALPHSPLHVKAMADVEEYVEQGHVYERIVLVRETRVTAILAHILIGLSIFLLPDPLHFIPRPVLDGLFLYLAISGLGGNQLFERICLLFTEQTAYPPRHYIRRVPQRMIHGFTATQIVQLAIMCAMGFAPEPYVKMCFPILLMLLLPIRHKLIPKIIDRKFLKVLDGH